MSVGDPLAQDSSLNRYGQAQPRRAAIASENQNTAERALPTLMMPIGVLLEFLPCAAALWSADRTECVFNGAAKSLLGYSENDFCANPGLWLERVDPRDRQVFLSAWKALQHGERKISCHYRFSRQKHARRIALEETAVLLPVGSSGTPAVLSLYQTKPAAISALRSRQPDDTAARVLVHHIGNSLQAIRGELDLLHLTRTLPQQSFDNITRGIEQLHDLMIEVMGLSGPERSLSAPSRCRSSDRAGDCENL